MHYGTQYGLSVNMGLVEQSVEVRQEGVSDIQVMPGGVHHERVKAVCCRVLVLLERDRKPVREKKLKSKERNGFYCEDTDNMFIMAESHRSRRQTWNDYSLTKRSNLIHLISPRI